MFKILQLIKIDQQPKKYLREYCILTTLKEENGGWKMTGLCFYLYIYTYMYICIHTSSWLKLNAVASTEQQSLIGCKGKGFVQGVYRCDNSTWRSICAASLSNKANVLVSSTRIQLTLCMWRHWVNTKYKCIIWKEKKVTGKQSAWIYQGYSGGFVW